MTPRTTPYRSGSGRLIGEMVKVTKQTLKDGKERGFLICLHRKGFQKGRTVTGSHDKVVIPSDSCQGERAITFHTHPKGSVPLPSSGDERTFQINKRIVEMCIGGSVPGKGRAGGAVVVVNCVDLKRRTIWRYTAKGV